MSKEIKQYGEQLQVLLDPASDIHQKLVQKGLLLYRQQLVYNKKISPTEIVGKVQDVTPVQVTLKLENPASSHCTCPKEGICRHQLALFFSAYSEDGSVFEWIQDWKREESATNILDQIKRGSDLLKEKTPVTLDRVEAWLARFQSAYRGIDPRNEFVLEVTCKNKYRGLIEYAPVEREWKPLYQLFAAYESMKIVNQLCSQYHIRTFKRFFEFMLDEADEALKILTVSAAPFAFDPYLSYLREDSIFLLKESSYYEYELVELYQLLWTFLFKQSIWRKLEYNRLSDLVKTDNGNRIKIGFIHLAILSGYDEVAIDEIQHYGEEITSFSSFWLKYLNEQKLYNRLYLYLNTIAAFVPSYLEHASEYDRYAFIRSFFQYINEGMLAEQNPLLLEKIYIQTLPHTYYQYSDYLFTKGKFKEWVELQQYKGIELEFIDRARLETIGKGQPHLLMPIYHEAIENMIAERNRDSYKKAVRYLKKLRILYKKQKTSDIWERFFESLLLKTKRLRAFHEECKRGKLIHA
ncbi:SWIM zinc finger family protein [Heyndrickxia vini]|uniref:SWIM zinc finger family protein n=1 Tax=Heyndrickxia vini TaxID=1476025 RepID=A0ABX7E0C2_9BACI|nr:SWIM zinc finger family protein [Heyndrickxia vini]QQZ09188.1 SWIM zinc finger family protein [Heyndrickxia vini]